MFDALIGMFDAPIGMFDSLIGMFDAPIGEDEIMKKNAITDKKVMASVSLVRKC